MPTISSQRSEKDMSWKELRLKFALLPKVLDDGTMLWFGPYQELWYCFRWKTSAYSDDWHYDYKMLRRSKVVENSIEEFHEIDVNELKKRLDSVQ